MAEQFTTSDCITDAGFVCARCRAYYTGNAARCFVSGLGMCCPDCVARVQAEHPRCPTCGQTAEMG